MVDVQNTQFHPPLYKANIPVKVEINYDISNTSDQFPPPQLEVETEPNVEYLERPIYSAEEARGRTTENQTYRI